MRFSRSVVIAGCAALALLGVLLFFAHENADVDRDILNRALTRQIDGHTNRVAAILATMNHAETNLIQEAVYNELQNDPPATLISRSNIQVDASADGRLECVIDISQYAFASREIFQAPSR